MKSSTRKSLLHQLAQLYGIQTAYYDSSHSRQSASTKSLLAILQALGAPIIGQQDIPQVLRDKQQARWQCLIEPVLLAWGNESNLVEIRLPESLAETRLIYALKCETGEELQGEWYGKNQAPLKSNEIEGIKYVTKQIKLPSKIPLGYHQLVLEVASRLERSLLISAPRKAYVSSREQSSRNWGIFLPLYSLHSQSSWGCASFTDLEKIMDWIGSLGGNVIATLPLLATFMNDIVETSPYLPISRLMWNEFYLDINSIPELKECTAAQNLLVLPSFQDEVETIRKLSLVDYQRQMNLKGKILKELSRHIFRGWSKRLEELLQFAKSKPAVDDYARFRATSEKQGNPWRLWPQPLKEGILHDDDYDEENRQYHLYVQWLAHEQMSAAIKKARDNKLSLYLDLPLGVHPDGYDVWREQDDFLIGTSVGAPPDAVFTKGQNWAFPPLHPEKIRQQHYRHVIAYLRHHLHYSDILRIDHVMGLHRLFCIPNSMEPNQGVYLRYQAEELYAILAIESQRSNTLLVGEDLGTVPRYVRPTMRNHGLHRMYIMHYELATNPENKPTAINSNSVASLNTHDIPPFAAFWLGTDIKERSRLGMLDHQGAKKEARNYKDMKRGLITFLCENGWLKEGHTDITSVLQACLSFLAASPARIVLTNLEDLWLETKPQNIPSTKAEYPNWQRKMNYSFEEFCQMPQVLATLQIINNLRKQVTNDKKV